MDFFTQLFGDLNTHDSLMILLFLLVAFLLGVLLGWATWGSKYKAARLELEQRNNELNTLRGQYNSLKEQFDLKDADLRKANLEIDDLYIRIRNLEGEKGQLHADLYECNEQMGKMQGVKDSLADMEAQNASLTEKLSGLGIAAKSMDKPMVLPKGMKKDDLKVVEGIGPKIEKLLKNAGINTWAELAGAAISRLQEILDEAGENFNMHDPATWPKQGELLAAGEWDKFKEYTDFLLGGKDPGGA